MRAVVCRPTSSIIHGLRMQNLGEINFQLAYKEHEDFCTALETLGFNLIYIPEDERYPDGVFTEDPAVILEDRESGKSILIMARLRREERRGEGERLRDILIPRFFKSFEAIEPPGFLEGGDVLVIPELKKLYVGISARTNEEGAEALAKIAKDFAGYTSHFINIPPHYLHLKGEVTFHPLKNDRHIIIVSEEIADNFVDSGARLLVTTAEERFGANCISREEIVLVRSGAEKTSFVLSRAGYKVREVNISQFMLIDGAMTCLWKRIPSMGSDCR